MNQNIYDNPFSQCTARDMSYDDVLAYWCSPFSSYNNLNEHELFSSKTPIFIEGARGSGKTMILKYLSYYCQKDYAIKDNQQDLFSYFEKAGSLGIYLRYKEDFVNMFSSLSCNNELKDMLFTYYFELLVSREVIQVVNDLFESSQKPNLTQEQSLIQSFSSYFTKEFVTLGQVVEFINAQILDLDLWVKNSRYYENSEEDLIHKIRRGLIHFIISSIRNKISSFHDMLFIIIIDEYENAQAYQRNINTYIKKVDSTEKITFRIGMRIEGISSYDTELGNEFLQVDRDFLLKRLVFKNNTEYKKFLRLISEKRLKSSSFFSTYNVTDIEILLGSREDVVEEALSVVEINPLKHFELLKSKLEASEFKKVLELLKCPNNPLIEMLNIIWILRGTSIDETYKQMTDYLMGNYNKNSKYKRDYVDKYKYQLVFILLNIHKQKQKLKKMYYSFNTFAFLSSGSVNDFISLCRNTFYELDNYYFANIEKQAMIPPVVQTNGAAKTALEQLGKIKANNENGTQMYTFVMNMGNWFTQFHKDPFAKYPETNQFAFENEALVESRPLLKSNLKSMIKWGVLIKKDRIQSISIGRRKGNVYYLNHIFAPIFNISYRIRGGFNPVLSTYLFEQMLFNSLEPKDIENLKKSNQITQNIKTDNTSEQLSLFGGIYL